MHLGMYDSSEEGAIAYFRHWEVTHPDELRRALVRQKQQKEKAAQQREHDQRLLEHQEKRARTLAVRQLGPGACT